jgi:hypothetical protein
MLASKQPDLDVPLRKLRPTGGWIGREPVEYFVRAGHAEEALSLAVYCDVVRQGKILARYTGRVAHTYAELSMLSGQRPFSVLVGTKPGPKTGERWLSSEISLLEDKADPHAPED